VTPEIPLREQRPLRRLIEMMKEASPKGRLKDTKRGFVVAHKYALRGRETSTAASFFTKPVPARRLHPRSKSSTICCDMMATTRSIWRAGRPAAERRAARAEEAAAEAVRRAEQAKADGRRLAAEERPAGPWRRPPDLRRRRRPPGSSGAARRGGAARLARGAGGGAARRARLRVLTLIPAALGVAPADRSGGGAPDRREANTRLLAAARSSVCSPGGRPARNRDARGDGAGADARPDRRTRRRPRRPRPRADHDPPTRRSPRRPDTARRAGRSPSPGLHDRHALRVAQFDRSNSCPRCGRHSLSVLQRAATSSRRRLPRW
jgi:hypothetical protein